MPIRLAVIILAVLLSLSAAAETPRKRIAITVDDLPLASAQPVDIAEAKAVNAALLDALAKHQARAVGFVNEDKLLVRGHIDDGVAVLQSWLAAGMELGNHNYGHVSLSRATLAESQDAVVRGDAVLRWLTAQQQAPLRYYRHPYTHTGRNDDERRAFDAFLAARGYQVAPFTVEHDDYLFACVYARLRTDGRRDEQQRIADDYVAHLGRSVAVFETMSQELFGRQVPQILLIHASRLNADTLDRSLQLLHEKGYDFVTLEQALRDEAYAIGVAASGTSGPSWLARWARAKGRKLSVYGQPEPDGLTAELAPRLCQ